MLNYEDRLHAWLLACWHGMAYWKGHGLLISAPQAVRELNALTDGPQIREDRLRKIVTEFKDTAPPYSSFDPPLKLRAEKQRERAAERAAKHRANMRERMREKRSAVEQVPPSFCGSKGIGTGPP